MSYKKFVKKTCEEMGVDFYCDLIIHDERTYKAIALNASLGLAESYMKGWWESENLGLLLRKLLRARATEKVKGISHISLSIFTYLLNLQNKAKSITVAKQHYNIGNDLYKAMLGSSMVYTCGYWQNAQDLETAQNDKLKLVADKLHLQPGMRVLDIGSGWGSSARFIAQNYGVHVTGICNSSEQYQYALAHKEDCTVEYILGDYRDLNGRFDRIYSLGMFEHVGFKNYATYFKKASDLLEENGLFLLHTIGHKKTSTNVDPFMHKYIFPGGILPSVELIGKHSSDYFTMEDWHNFGVDYARTLEHWKARFDNHWDELKHNYDTQFQRMWHYYLNAAAASFALRHNHLWQIVFSKGIENSKYLSMR